MRYLILISALFFLTFSFGQNNNSAKKATLNNLKIEVTVDSLNDLRALKVSDLNDLFDDVCSNSDLEFRLTCKSDHTSLSKKVSYKINGNSNKKKAFIKMISKLKKSAKNYYKNNN